MVKGISSFTMSVTDAADEKLQSDPALQRQWDNFSDRIRLVYADPESAFKAMRMEAVVEDPNVARQRLGEIERNAARSRGKRACWRTARTGKIVVWRRSMCRRSVVTSSAIST